MAILAIVNNAAMNRGVQTSVLVLFSALLHCIHRSGIAGSYGPVLAKFFDELPYCSCFIVLFSALQYVGT